MFAIDQIHIFIFKIFVHLRAKEKRKEHISFIDLFIYSSIYVFLIYFDQ